MRGDRLDIPRLQQTHVGDYTCEANNEAGPGSDTASVDVLGQLENHVFSIIVLVHNKYSQ